MGWDRIVCEVDCVLVGWEIGEERGEKSNIFKTERSEQWGEWGVAPMKRKIKKRGRDGEGGRNRKGKNNQRHKHKHNHNYTDIYLYKNLRGRKRSKTNPEKKELI